MSQNFQPRLHRSQSTNTAAHTLDLRVKISASCVGFLRVVDFLERFSILFPWILVLRIERPRLGGGFVEGAITGLLCGVVMKVTCGESKRPRLQFTRTTEQCAN